MRRPWTAPGKIRARQLEQGAHRVMNFRAPTHSRAEISQPNEEERNV